MKTQNESREDARSGARDDLRSEPRGRAAGLFTAALIGGSVLVASLGATAGWMMHASLPGTTAAVPTQMALAPSEAVVGAADGSARPVRSLADASGKPAPMLSPAPGGAATPSASSPSHQPHPATPAHRPVAAAGPSADAQASGTGQAQPLRTHPVTVCATCGTVESVREVRRKGEANGIGAVAGGVVGGLRGHQIGKGHGRDAMTVVGAIGGGFAGHEVEKRVRAETVYEVQVRMDDGRTRTLTQKIAPRVGSRVTVDGGVLHTVSTSEDGQRT